MNASTSFLTLFPFMLVPTVVEALPVPLQSPTPLVRDERPLKRSRIETNGEATPTISDLMDEVATLASVFSNTLEL